MVLKGAVLTRSRYLHLVQGEKCVIAFSALSGGMVALQPELAGTLTSSSSGKLQVLAKRYPELLFIGAIVNKGVDERDLVRVRMGQARYGQRWLEATLVPTLACNMRCIYCNQPDDARSWTMTDEITKALLDYIDKRIADREGFCVTWYGGEPLLVLDRLLSMQSSILALCGKHGKPLVATLITNGLLLDPPTAKRLAISGIRQVQVTLDGPPEVHDRRRQTRGGNGTFRRILNNVLAVQEFIEVRLRVNLDTSNTPHFTELLELLRGCDLLEKAYVAPVIGLNTPCSATKIPFLNGPEFGAVIAPQVDRMSCELPTLQLTPVPLPCTAPSESSYVFGPMGNVYRCWHELGHPELAFDHVKDAAADPARRLFWLTYDPLTYPECAECDVLPLCLGGCPDMRQKGVEPPMCCTPLRSHLPEFIRSYASRSATILQSR